MNEKTKYGDVEILSFNALYKHFHFEKSGKNGRYVSVGIALV